MRMPHIHTAAVHVHVPKPHIRKARLRKVKVRAHTRKVRLKAPKTGAKTPPRGSLGALAYEPESYAPLPDEGGEDYATGGVDQDMEDQGAGMPEDAGTIPTPTLGALGRTRGGY